MLKLNNFILMRLSLCSSQPENQEKLAPDTYKQ